MGTEARQMLIGWFRELGSASAAYLVALAGSAWALGHLPPGIARTSVILLPVLPGLYLVWRTAHLYRRCDEYVRLHILKAAAWAAGITAAWTMVYAFLELAGLPRLSIVWVVNVGWAVFVGQVVRFILSHR
jgi:hypothetical protein